MKKKFRIYLEIDCQNGLTYYTIKTKIGTCWKYLADVKSMPYMFKTIDDADRFICRFDKKNDNYIKEIEI